MYLYELVNWLTTVVDTLVIKDAYKDDAYKSAVDYLADCLMVRAAPTAAQYASSHSLVVARRTF